jgi:enediyne biosynthesis protein E4
LDFDGDGLLDIYLVQGGSVHPGSTNVLGNKLYRNLGNGQFEDVSESAGVGDTGYGMGCACADYDGDGNIDIYVTNVGPNVLYRNNGDGTFTDVTEPAGVGDPSWGTSAAFFDYDLDGHLDLVIANYIHWSPEREINCFSRGGLRDYCSPLNYESPARDTLYRNRGDGTFENVTVAAGLDQAFGTGLGVVCADFTGNGLPDIYVANDAMPNQLWVNQGNGRFTEEAMIRGCAVNAVGISEAGMGVVAVDLHQNGALDLFITHLVGEANRLYINADGYFIDQITRKGPGARSWPYTGFGVGFFDFDHDGHLDLYVANGRVKYGQQQLDPNDPYAEPDNLFRGLGGGEFEEILPHGGTHPALVAAGRGAAFGDLNNNGRIDIVVSNRDGPVHLLMNRAGAHGNWIQFRVLNRKGTDAIGARLRIETAGKTAWGQVLPNQGYCSSNDPRVHFGLGETTEVDQVTVFWPDQSEQTFGPLAAGVFHELRQGP